MPKKQFQCLRWKHRKIVLSFDFSFLSRQKGSRSKDSLPRPTARQSTQSHIIYHLHSGDSSTSNSSKILLYADDIVIYDSHPNLDYATIALQQSIDTFAQYCSKLSLFLSSQKCKSVLFTCGPVNPIVANNTKITISKL